MDGAAFEIGAFSTLWQHLARDILVRAASLRKLRRTRIKTFIDLLPSHSFIGTRADDPTIRRLVVTPSGFYEVTEDEVVIHNIRHSARNPSTMPHASGRL
jgi:plasmid stabilization system protein ParE